uniref:ERCC4 domain-containing protein n=1 Tax=viral metagenome TaxID=1070528 RepID=A0A6C0BA05_9ZZZZ
MKIKIDHREHDLIKSCKYFLEISPLYKEIELEICNLPVGDIILCDNTDSEKILIERKTLSDLAASIKDGRYEEQSFRLNGLPMPNHNIMYIIEGDLNKIQTFKSKIEKSVLYSAIFSLNYYKGFSVLRSQSIEETALMICHMIYKLKKGISENKESYYKETKENENQTETNETNEKNYCNVIKRVKKENITINNIGEIMLSQIPGISSTTATAIIQQFKGLPQLVLSLKENPDCLKDIAYCNAKGQTRKINKSAIEHVKLYLQVL